MEPTSYFVYIFPVVYSCCLTIYILNLHSWCWALTILLYMDNDSKGPFYSIVEYAFHLLNAKEPT